MGEGGKSQPKRCEGADCRLEPLTESRNPGLVWTIKSPDSGTFWDETGTFWPSKPRALLGLFFSSLLRFLLVTPAPLKGGSVN